MKPLTRDAIKRKRPWCECWVQLLSSDWFTYFLNYIDWNDIAILDLSFCNHTDRLTWLCFLTCFQPSSLVTVSFTNRKFEKWLLLKGIYPQRLSLDCTILQESINEEPCIGLIKHNSNLKELRLTDSLERSSILSLEMLQSIAEGCQQLENIELSNIQIPDGGFEVLSLQCHKLQSIKLHDTYCAGLDKLIRVNKCLRKLTIKGFKGFTSISSGEILTCLGQCCPLLEVLRLAYSNVLTTVEPSLTESQVKIFTKGCPNLFIFHIQTAPDIKISNKLLWCLGTYNPRLAVLSVFSYRLLDFPSDSLSEESLRCLSHGCPGLAILSLIPSNFSAQSVNYLVNNLCHLASLSLYSPSMCSDGSVGDYEGSR